MGTLSSRHCRMGAFSLLELLVTISVIGIVLSISLPALREAREAATVLRVIRVQNECWKPLRFYANDHRDAFPFFGKPGTDEAELWADGERIVDDYWAQTDYWGAFLYQQGYAGHLAMRGRPDFEPPAPEDRDWKQVSDRATGGMFASPEFWTEGRTLDTTLHQKQHWFTIRFPSSKGLVMRPEHYDTWQYRGPGARVVVTFADGHTDNFHLWNDLLPGVPMPTWHPGGTPVYTTRLGLLGRDL